MNILQRLFGRKQAEPDVLLILLSAPFRIECESLEAAAQRAWTPRFGANDDGNDFVVSGTPDSGFVLSPYGNAFIVFPTVRGIRNVATPRNLTEPGCSEAWTNYVADVSIGLVHNYENSVEKMRAYIATLTAELIDEKCLGLLQIANERVHVAKDLAQQLRTNPRAFFP
jgi:hypothetical protein